METENQVNDKLNHRLYGAITVPASSWPLTYSLFLLQGEGAPRCPVVAALLVLTAYLLNLFVLHFWTL